MEMGWFYMKSKYLRWNSYIQANAYALLYTPTLSHLTLNFSVQWKYLATKLSIMSTDA